LVPARLVARELDILDIPDFMPVLNRTTDWVPEEIQENRIFVDDIYDTGEIMTIVKFMVGVRFVKKNLYVCLYSRFPTKEVIYGRELGEGERDKYIEFPWEATVTEAI
jgi:hypoxanthine phosphoribosyltransferase